MVKSKEYSGRWKIPQTDFWYDGILKFSQELGAELRLFGSFKEHFFDNAKRNVIIGETSEGNITLINSYHRRTSSGNGIVVEILEPSLIFEGIICQNEDELQFSGVVFKAHNLFQWFNLSNLELTNLNYNSKKYSIAYSANENIDFQISENLSGYILIVS